jgi:uncharacterized protein (TIGR03663 family)
MHTDEAVHAIKFGALLEYGYYRYDKNEYHGPTLNYFTLPAAWIKSRKTLSSLDESTLRIIPACAGIGMILLLFFLFDGFGLTLIIIISLLTAISPLLIFYSRYYIQETLLVFFNFGSIVSIYRFIQSGKTPWLIITGIFLGLMYATKETSLMNFLIMILAFCFTLYIRFKKYKEAKKYLLNYRPWHIILLAGTAIMVSVLFYSSFFSNMKGVIDSITTHQAYFSKAGSGEVHIHPWYYYLQLLIFSKSPSGMIWSEVWIIICACAGFFYLTKKRNDHSIHYYLILFIGINTLLQVLVYSAIPYKTPWNMMGFYHGLIIIAAYGIYQVFNTNMKLSNRIIPVVFTLAGSLHLIIQAFLLNFKTPTDPYHPYVYAQTGNDIFEIVSRIDSVSSANPLGKEMPVDVIFPGHDYWPLPWYLRTYKNVGYREHVDLNQPAAPLILSSPDVEKEIIHYLYEAPPPGEKYLYVPLFDTYMELRPMVEIKGYLRKDAWDHFNQARFR